MTGNPLELFRKFFGAVRAIFWLCGSFLAPKLLYPPPLTPFFAQRAFFRDGGGNIMNPPWQELYTSRGPFFACPPALEGYFQGWGGVLNLALHFSCGFKSLRFNRFGGDSAAILHSALRFQIAAISLRFEVVALAILRFGQLRFWRFKLLQYLN